MERKSDFNSKKVIIIAEIGSNHNGDLATAFQLIDKAAEAGADIVKFQSFLVDDLLAHDDPNYERLKKLQMPRNWYKELMARCKDRRVRFLSTATNFKTLDWMEEFNAWGYKVASGNITYRPLIDRLIEIGKPVIVSTGLARFEEITELSKYFQKKGLPDYAFLHCVSRYPTEPEDLKLGNIVLLRKILPCPVGFSDHSLGSHIAVAAVTLGARIIEKHISLDKTGPGMDHEVAVLPDEFRTMCQAVRDAEVALYADPTPDYDGMFKMRRSLHFARDMELGGTITPNCIKIVRPEDGLAPARYQSVIGRKVNNKVARDEPVREELLLND